MGSLIGSSLGGSAGYFLTNKKKGRKKRIKNAILAALAGGAAGGLGGGMLNADANYRRISALADGKRNAQEAPIPGRMYYVTFPNHRYKTNGLGNNAPIQHSTILTIPKADAGNDYGLHRSYGSTSDTQDNPGSVEVNLYDGFKGLDPQGVAKRILTLTNGRWGNKVDVNWVDVPDITAADRYSDAFMEDRLHGNYGILPGQSNCGTYARDLFEYARKSRIGHLLDMLIGGRPSTNAPSFKTNFLSYTEN